MTKAEVATPPRVLVVDDEPQNLELIEAILAPAGYEVLLASNGEKALALTNEKQPALIILDLMMPGLSGFEVCARVKMQPETMGIPILFVTSLSQPGDKERALAAGGDDFLTKPFQRADLLARVEALLKVRHLNTELDSALAYLNELELARHDRRPRKDASPPTPPPGAGVILVVDDEATVLAAFQAALQAKGYEVVLAGDGREALRVLRHERFDLIFLDIVLPEVSGASVLRALKRRDPEALVVLITGYPHHKDTLAALEYGPAMLLPKPIKLADLDAVLKIVFKGREGL